MWNKLLRLVPVVIPFSIGILISAAAGYIAVQTIPSLRHTIGLAPCTKETNSTLVVECVFRAIEPELKNYGVTAATEIFAQAYRQFPEFVREVCHPQAHRLGDMTYYQIYYGVGNLDAIEFPQATTACGYGFYHGFLEHLVQDNPDPAFVTKTCDYLVTRLGKTMGAIEQICYHGSGHGLMIAHAEVVPKSEWGNIEVFTRKPLSQCESFVNANEKDIEQCKEGIFNILNQWMVLGQYGFVFDTTQPFVSCTGIPEPSRKACYAEMAQKIDGIANEDPEQIFRIAETVPAQYRAKVFRTGIAGAVQNVLFLPNGYEQLLESCTRLQEYYQPCLENVINGLYEHGEPQEEYKKALAACGKEVVALDQKKFCYRSAMNSLARFYTPERIPSICSEFPDLYQETCMSVTKSFVQGTDFSGSK